MFTQTIEPRFNETDALGHINNAVIAEWFEGARLPVFKIFSPELKLQEWKLIVAKISIDFHKETLFGKDVEIRTYISRIGRSSFDVYQEVWQQDEKTASGIAVMVQFDHKRKKSIPLDEGQLKKMQEHPVMMEE